MAKKRGRSQLDWFIFSFLFSPILSITLLAFLGETEERKKKKISEKEELRKLAKYAHIPRN